MSSTAIPGLPAGLGSVSTPNKADSRIGTLEFDDGAPSDATAALLYDHLDFMHGVEAFLGALPGASLAAVRRGFLAAGVEDGSFSMFPELMDSASMFLTANCDTIYFWGFLDLSDGPMVIDVPSIDAPSGILATVDDMWFRWVTDIGLPGPDRGEGGRYLIVGPGYDGPLPDSGFHVSHSCTSRDHRHRASVHDRQRSQDRRRGDPHRAQGVPVRSWLLRHRGGDVPSGRLAVGSRAGDPGRRASSRRRASRSTPCSPTTSASGSSSTSSCSRSRRRRAIRRSSASSPRSASRTASPSSRTSGCARSSRTAVEVGNATARTVTFAARPEEGFAFYPDSSWESALFVGGYEFVDPPPEITADGVVPVPSDGARKLNARTNFFYMATGITPAMCMRLTGIGSQYIYAMRDSEGEFFDGARSYRLTLPPDIPESRFWSLLLYDRQTRSMLQTDQPMPRVGSQPGTLADEPGRHHRHLLRADRARGQGEQLAPDRPGQGLVDDPAALQPAPGLLRQDLAALRDRTDLTQASSLDPSTPTRSADVCHRWNTRTPRFPTPWRCRVSARCATSWAFRLPRPRRSSSTRWTSSVRCRPTCGAIPPCRSSPSGSRPSRTWASTSTTWASPTASSTPSPSGSPPTTRRSTPSSTSTSPRVRS